ncbi:hypothetical protein B0H13DRAFT_2503583 [Mycena leptocephala]|nr:hypothetical protein B0H13DRAFT_2503583 [Mycena leptocephala]
MAPETLDPTLTDLARTPASDIYAFACVCLEVTAISLTVSAGEWVLIFQLYTGYPPFHAFHDAAVMFQVVGGMRPGRPARDVIPTIFGISWSSAGLTIPRTARLFWELCWSSITMDDRASRRSADPIPRRHRGEAGKETVLFKKTSRTPEDNDRIR